MEDYYLTKLTEDVSILEKPFCSDGEDFTDVYAFNETDDRIEYVGTSYSKMSYYYNKDYIIFATEDDIEFVFDVNGFDFITDERAKRRAFDKMMNWSMLEMLSYEKSIVKSDRGSKYVKALKKRIEIPN